MKFTDLNHEIKKLECKLYHFLNQSIYFRWGKENAQKRLDNLKKEYNTIESKINNTSFEDFEKELKKVKQEYISITGQGLYKGYKRNSLQNKICYLEELAEIKKAK